MDSYDLIIIGAGPAGLAASIYALERQLKTLIVEANVPGGQLVTLYPHKNIYDYPGFGSIKGSHLAQKMVEHAVHEGAQIEESMQVSRVIPHNIDFTVKTERGELDTKAVILATGMGHYQPRKLGIPGEEELKSKGIFYQKLPERLVGKRIVVIGGGDTALETAVTAAEKGATVTVIHRSPEFRALEKTLSHAKSLSLPLYTSVQTIAFHGDEKVDRVEIIKSNGAHSFLSTDLVAVCIGVELHNTFLSQLGVTIDKQAVVVNPDMQTSVPGIFACGDITVPTGKYKRISIAVGSAAVAVNGAYQYLKHPYWAKKQE